MRIANCELRIANCKLRIANCESGKRKTRDGMRGPTSVGSSKLAPMEGTKPKGDAMWGPGGSPRNPQSAIRNSPPPLLPALLDATVTE